MDITKIDRNFLDSEECSKEPLQYFDVAKPPFSMFGMFYDAERGTFLRMPQEIADTVNEGVSCLNNNTAGGRIRFSTNANGFNIIVKYKEMDIMPHMTLRGSKGFSLSVNSGNGEKFLASFGPTAKDTEGFSQWIGLPKDGKYYTLYFPLYHAVDNVFIGFSKTAEVGAGLPYKDIKPILYYGSSITQGGCANRADTSYPGLICLQNDVDYINLGFSGNALAEPQMIEYLSTIDCSVAVLDYDCNAPTVEYLQKTHYPMYEIYRKNRPTTPIIFVSKPNYYYDATAQARVNVIRETYKKAKRLGDNNVYFIDGRRLFGKDYPLCTVDRTHPTDLGFYKMAKVIGRTVNSILENQQK